MQEEDISCSSRYNTINMQEDTDTCSNDLQEIGFNDHDSGNNSYEAEVDEDEDIGGIDFNDANNEDDINEEDDINDDDNSDVNEEDLNEDFYDEDCKTILC